MEYLNVFGYHDDPRPQVRLVEAEIVVGRRGILGLLGSRHNLYDDAGLLEPHLQVATALHVLEAQHRRTLTEHGEAVNDGGRVEAEHEVVGAVAGVKVGEGEVTEQFLLQERVRLFYTAFDFFLAFA